MSPSTGVQRGNTQARGVLPHLWREQLRTRLCELAQRESSLSRSFALQPRQRWAQERGQHPQSKLPLVPTDAPSPSSRLRRSAVHKYMQHDRARFHANVQNTNETCLDSQTARQFPSSSAPLGRIYNFTFPFSGIKVKVTHHSCIWRPRQPSAGSGDEKTTQWEDLFYLDCNASPPNACGMSSKQCPPPPPKVHWLLDELVPPGFVWWFGTA